MLMVKPFYLVIPISELVLEFVVFDLEEVDCLGMCGENILQGLLVLPGVLLL